MPTPLRPLLLLATLIAPVGWTADKPPQPPQPHQQATHVPQADWPATSVRDRLGLCSGIDINAKGEVHVFHRANRVWTNPLPTEAIADPTILVIDASSGKLLRALAANQFVMPHGITLDREDNIWVTDVVLHQVVKLSPKGEPLLVLGESRRPGTGPAHFNMPTDVAHLADGSILVSDGYKNARVAHFDAGGRFLNEWGRSGRGEGEFRLPHALAASAHNHVYVCDRTNARVQVFDQTGSFLRMWNLSTTGIPYGIALLPHEQTAIVSQDPMLPDDPHITILDKQGDVLSRFGMTGSAPGELRGAHDIAASPDGTFYTAEISGRRIQKWSPRKSTKQPQ
jgi:DNA-binding beta-propeller fold protein YncE